MKNTRQLNVRNEHSPSVAGQATNRLGTYRAASIVHEPLELDVNGERGTTIYSFWENTTTVDQEGKLPFTPKHVYCTNGPILIINRVEHTVVSSFVRYSENRNYMYCSAISYQNRTVSDIVVVRPGMRLQDFRECAIGTYEPSPDCKVLTRPSVNMVQVPDEYEIKETYELYHSRYSITRSMHSNALWRHRLYKRWCCCMLPDVIAPVDEVLFEELRSTRMQYGADAQSESSVRHVGAKASTLRTNGNKLLVSETLIRSTTLLFAYLATIVPSTASEYELVNIPEFQPSEVIPTKQELMTTDPAVQTMFCKTFMCVKPPIFPVLDNGNFDPTKSKKGHMTYDNVNGLLVDGDYCEEEYRYIIGPCAKSNSIIYARKTSAGYMGAFTRLVKSRGLSLEPELRRNQDFNLSLLMSNKRIKKLQQMRNLGKHLSYLQGWGHTEKTLATKLAKAKKRTHFDIRFRGIFDAWIRQLQHTMHLDENHIQATCETILARNELYALEAMQKREQKLRAVLAQQEHPELVYTLDPKIYVLGNVKSETAKVGKNARFFLSFGPQVAMQDPYPAKALKSLMSQELVVVCAPIDAPNHKVGLETHSFRFIAESEVSVLDVMFNDIRLLHELNRRSLATTQPCSRYYCHSDDHSLTTICAIGGQIEAITVDLDISTCDLSHGPSVMMLLSYFAHSLLLDIDELLCQLKQFIILKHPDLAKDDTLILEMKYPTLLSGSVLTTALNTFVCSLLCFAYASQLSCCRAFSDINAFREMLTNTAHKLGYIVTMELTRTPIVQDFDRPFGLSTYKFLMYYPVRAEDGFGTLAIPCFGRLFRNFGIAEEPLTREEAESRCKQVVQGFLSCHTSRFHELISQLVLQKPHLSLPINKDDFTDSGHLNFNRLEQRCKAVDADVAARYGCTEEEFAIALSDFFGTVGLTPRIVSNPVITNILRVDYGLEEE